MLSNTLINWHVLLKIKLLETHIMQLNTKAVWLANTVLFSTKSTHDILYFDAQFNFSPKSDIWMTSAYAVIHQQYSQMNLTQYQAGFFFSAEISEISPKTGFIGDYRYFLIPSEIFRYSMNMF
jgi:hypothetical protein